ncbi:SPFH domain-containing protein [Arachnia propionica]|uniref:SPFH domain-containing protein n=2 Tax=Arachnia propionica TaxID=1750 RepID=A0A3P1T7V6_9ACTN|nr:SPFH domain-containing protein [Arachnia propionica]
MPYPAAPTGQPPRITGNPVGITGSRVRVQEKSTFAFPGLLAIPLIAAVALGLAMLLSQVLPIGPTSGLDFPLNLGIFGMGAAALGFLVLSTGLVLISPGEAKVLEFLGSYIGTIKKPGLWFVTPFTTKRRISVKVHNFETNELKVNDADGNPINIAAIVVWQVADTAKAIYAVEGHEYFIRVQAEAALRHIAMSHPYDNDAVEVTLRGDTEVIASEMAAEVAARIGLAGLEVIETRISSLAYASEIAQAMLQRQQASAIIAAREKIVEGAVSMVEDALGKLESSEIVSLTPEHRATMVSNLLVVLCGDSRATPVVNTGLMQH